MTLVHLMVKCIKQEKPLVQSSVGKCELTADMSKSLLSRSEFHGFHRKGNKTSGKVSSTLVFVRWPASPQSDCLVCVNGGWAVRVHISLNKKMNISFSENGDISVLMFDGSVFPRAWRQRMHTRVTAHAAYFSCWTKTWIEIESCLWAFMLHALMCLWLHSWEVDLWASTCVA